MFHQFMARQRQLHMSGWEKVQEILPITPNTLRLVYDEPETWQRVQYKVIFERTERTFLFILQTNKFLNHLLDRWPNF